MSDTNENTSLRGSRIAATHRFAQTYREFRAAETAASEIRLRADAAVEEAATAREAFEAAQRRLDSLEAQRREADDRASSLRDRYEELRPQASIEDLLDFVLENAAATAMPMSSEPVGGGEAPVRDVSLPAPVAGAPALGQDDGDRDDGEGVSSPAHETVESIDEPLLAGVVPGIMTSSLGSPSGDDVDEAALIQDLAAGSAPSLEPEPEEAVAPVALRRVTPLPDEDDKRRLADDGDEQLHKYFHRLDTFHEGYAAGRADGLAGATRKVASRGFLSSGYHYGHAEAAAGRPEDYDRGFVRLLMDSRGWVPPQFADLRRTIAAEIAASGEALTIALPGRRKRRPKPGEAGGDTAQTPDHDDAEGDDAPIHEVDGDRGLDGNVRDAANATLASAGPEVGDAHLPTSEGAEASTPGELDADMPRAVVDHVADHASDGSEAEGDLFAASASHPLLDERGGEPEPGIATVDDDAAVEDEEDPDAFDDPRSFVRQDVAGH